MIVIAFMSILFIPLKGLFACVLKVPTCVHDARACQHIWYPGPGVCLWVCVQETVCVGMFMCIFGCICVPRGCNSAQDSFIKYATGSEVAVNQFYLLCAGGQLSWHPWTLTPQERTGWILLLQLCFEGWSWEGFGLLLTWCTWGEKVPLTFSKITQLFFSFSFFNLIFYFSLGQKETEVGNTGRPQIICPTQHRLAFKFLITALDVLMGRSCYLEVQPC